MGDEQFRDVVLLVEHARHLRLLNPGQAAIGDRLRRRYSQRLTGETPVTEELVGAQKADDRFLALLGGDGELHLAAAEVEHCVRRISLAVDGAVRAIFDNRLSPRNYSQHGFPIDWRAFLICRNNLRLPLLFRHHHLPLRLLCHNGRAIRPENTPDQVPTVRKSLTAVILWRP